jgi:hypothetical protein
MLAVWVGIAGCLPPGSLDDDVSSPTLAPPTITDVSLSCDLEADRWQLEVVTDAWSGGGGVVWTEDGVYIETHENLRSVKAAGSGHRDTLRADIDIVEDFRPAGSNGNTAFSCRVEPTAYVFVLDLEQELSDCVILGPFPGLLRDVPDVPLCTRLWADDAQE